MAASAASDAVVASAATDAVAAAAASESLLACAVAAAGAAVACELAAMAAAAIASGAVALPDFGSCNGSIGRRDGDGIGNRDRIRRRRGSCRPAAPSTARSVAEVSSEEGCLSADLVAPAFAVPDFVPGRCVVSDLAVPPAAAWRGTGIGIGVGGLCPALVSRPFEPLVAVWLAGAASGDRVLSAGAGASSLRRCGAACWGAAAVAASLAASAAVLLSTMAPKLSVPDDGSDRAGRCGAAWNDTLVLVLTSRSTRAASRSGSGTYGQQGPGHPGLKKLCCIFQCLDRQHGQPWRGGGGRLFCPAARFAVWPPAKRAERDCLTGIPPILKSSFSAAAVFRP